MDTSQEPTADPQLTRTGGERAGVSSPAPHPPGYELLEEIGRGGMGVVYKARDLALDREVAVKVLGEQFEPGSSTAARFVDEARITSQLQHPGIPAVYRVGEFADGRPFLAMKLIKGNTLDTLLKASARVDRLSVFESLCQAVGYAHAHRVIHRDLKPANVMVGAFGEVQVMDWGLAKLVPPGGEADAGQPDPHATAAGTVIQDGREADTPFTRAGSILGTPAFMSPEQAAGEVHRVGIASDVFGLGAILCALLTGRPPYTGGDFDSVRVKSVRGKTDEAFDRLDASGADPGVIALCKRCLSFEPAARPADGHTVAATVTDLRRAADERARQAEREKHSAEVRESEQRKRRRVVQWAAAAVSVVLAAGITVSLWQAKVARQEAFDAETARMNEQREKERAEEARKQANAQLAVTAATAGDLAGKRGDWQEAARQYDRALELGAADPYRLRTRRLRAVMALGRYADARKELGALLAVPDLGRFRGPLLLTAAEYSAMLGVGDDTPPEVYVRQAEEADLDPADANYARVYRAKTVPEAIAHAKRALEHDPDHLSALNLIAGLGFFSGAPDDALRALARLQFLLPNATAVLYGEVWAAALDRDRPRLERAVAGIETGNGKKVAGAVRAIGEILVELQDEQALTGGLTLDKRLKGLAVLAELPNLAAELVGTGPKDGRKLDSLTAFRLPMFRALGELPAFKKLNSNDTAALLGLLSDTTMLVEVFGPIADAMPDGGFLLFHALALQKAGRLTEAEVVCRRALATKSFVNHRKRCQLLLVELQSELAYKGPEKERADWQSKTLTGLRDLARSGPLPAGWAVYASSLALRYGDTLLALDITRVAVEKDSKDRELMIAHIYVLARMNFLTVAESEARKLLTQTIDSSQAQRVLDALDSMLSGFDPATGTNLRLALGQFVLSEKERRFGPEDLAVAQTKYLLGRVFLRTGDPRRGVPLVEEYLAAQRKALAKQPAYLARQCLMVGDDLSRAGQHEVAAVILNEAFTLEALEPTRKFFPNERLRAGRLLALAHWHSGQKVEGARRLAELYPQLADAYAGRPVAGGLVGVSWEELTEVVRVLIDHATAEGKPDEASAWKAKLPRERLPLPRPAPEK